VIWARDEADQAVKGFLVRTSLPGYSAEMMQGKIAQRTVHNGLITMRDVRVAEADRLQNARSFADLAVPTTLVDWHGSIVRREVQALVAEGLPACVRVVQAGASTEERFAAIVAAFAS